MGPHGEIGQDGNSAMTDNAGSIPAGSTKLSAEDIENLEATRASLEDANGYVSQVNGMPANGISVMITSLIERVERVMRQDDAD